MSFSIKKYSYNFKLKLFFTMEPKKFCIFYYYRGVEIRRVEIRKGSKIPCFTLVFILILGFLLIVKKNKHGDL